MNTTKTIESDTYSSVITPSLGKNGPWGSTLAVMLIIQAKPIESGNLLKYGNWVRLSKPRTSAMKDVCVKFEIRPGISPVLKYIE